MSPPLVPTRLRRPAVLVALACWVLAAVLGAQFVGQHRPGGLDATIATDVHHVLTEQGMFARVLTGPTHPIVVYPVIALAVGVAVFRRWWPRAVFAIAAPGLCVLLTELLFKPLVGRTDDGVLSYPSGHTVSAVSAFAAAALVISVGWRPAARWTVVGLLVALWLVFAIGLVGMDYHYFTDTVGGFLVAVGVVVPLALLTDSVSARLAARRPTPPGAIHGSRSTGRGVSAA